MGTAWSTETRHPNSITKNGGNRLRSSRRAPTAPQCQKTGANQHQQTTRRLGDNIGATRPGDIPRIINRIRGNEFFQLFPRRSFGCRKNNPLIIPIFSDLNHKERRRIYGVVKVCICRPRSPPTISIRHVISVKAFIVSLNAQHKIIITITNTHTNITGFRIRRIKRGEWQIRNLHSIICSEILNLWVIQPPQEHTLVCIHRKNGRCN